MQREGSIPALQEESGDTPQWMPPKLKINRHFSGAVLTCFYFLTLSFYLADLMSVVLTGI